MSSEEQYQDEQHHENEMNEDIIYNQDMNKPLINEDLTTRKIKEGHEIILEEENKAFFLLFKSLGNNLKILLSEQDAFPAKTYEIYLALEELKLKNELFSKFSSTKQLSEELNNNDNKINFIIKKKGNIMSLTIIFPVKDENIDNDIEIDLIENIIDNREMFRQLFEKYKSIQEEQNEDISQFLNWIKNIDEILATHGENREQSKENNENQGEQNENEQVEKNPQEQKGKEVEKSSNKQSMSSIKKGKNNKKGNFEKKRENNWKKY